ncbi:hypothetical protein NDU88_009934 [Pleurodeles waltl]|uniref:Uncharacterized protein n=1 Tax=Pleurodeles waltl TaxID=8319 RepID=A0AAV7QYV2_PLEWA|nr:hypothetical protein NDU88_009934 [Pleurodeles waltl]
MQDTLNRILGAIEDTKLTLSQEIGKVSAELSHLQTDHHKLLDRVKAIETTLDDLQPAHHALQVQVAHLSEQIQKLEHRAEDEEGLSRCNNVRIVGLPEGVEGPDQWPIYSIGYALSWARNPSHHSLRWKEHIRSQLVDRSRGGGPDQ